MKIMNMLMEMISACGLQSELAKRPVKWNQGLEKMKCFAVN